MTIETPSLNRRRLLIGLAAASTAAAVPAAAIATAPTLPAENPELIRLGDMIATVAAEFHAAAQNEESVFAEWNHRLPRAPHELRQSDGGTDDVERDLSGLGISENGQLVYVIGSDWFIHRRKGCEKALRSKRPRHPLTAQQTAEIKDDLAQYRQWEATSLEYEAERQRVFDASGYAAVKAARRAALTKFGELIRAIMAEPAESMTGVIVQAQALEAWGAVPLLDQVLATVSDKEGVWATRFAAAVLRIASA
jgi:hypothetical protein